jgi:hypothetical protein
VYDPSSYVSILKNHPVEWFDNAMSYGVFNWGLNPVGVRLIVCVSVYVFCGGWMCVCFVCVHVCVFLWGRGWWCVAVLVWGRRGRCVCV